ncbi:MAG: response regulator [Gammaproteobacteria bacterium]|nr:response regulator [Gammaproteobacteria bacterium]
MRLPFSFQIIAGIVVIEVVMLVIIIINNIRVINETYTELLYKSAREQSALLSSSVMPGLIAYDYALVEDAIAIVKARPDLDYVAVYDADERMIFNFGQVPQIKEQFNNRELHQEYENGDQINVFRLIKFENQKVGSLKIGFNTKQIQKTINHISLQNISVAIIAMVILIIATVIISLFLTRKFKILKAGVEQFSEGDLEYKIEIKGNDEISDLSQQFNQMANRINNNRQKLLQQHNELEQRVEQRTQELQLARQNAEYASKAKSDFLSCMSHELRTPLNAVIGFTHVLLSNNINDEQERIQKLNKIDNSAKLLLALINDILDFSKIESGKLKLESTTLCLADIMENIFDLIRNNASEKSIEIAFDIGSDIPDEMIGDPLRIGQILLNFANNAVKFTESGAIILKASKLSQDMEDIRLKFEVIDSGIGLSEQQRGRLFKEFSQADDSTARKYGGSGLGLVISKRLATLMDGDIGVESVLGKGSTFWFTAKLKLASDTSTITRFELPEFSQKRALVVDDLPEAREIHQKLLENLKMQIDTACSGEQAISMVQTLMEQNQQYDIILMDWQMPNINGIETTRQIRSMNHTNNTLYLLVSAYNDIPMEKCENSDCFNGILQKPLTASQLYDTLINIDKPSQLITHNTKTDKIPNWSHNDYQILIVEDNKTNQEVISDILSPCGLKIDIADNGQIAIDKIQRNNYSLILMDVQMPVMDGLTATRIIRKTHKLDALPIIAMTANAFEDDKNQSLSAGMNEHLSKPIVPKLLYKSLTHWLSDVKEVNSSNQTYSADETNNNTMLKLSAFKEIDTDAALIFFNHRKDNYIKELERFSSEKPSHIEQIQTLINNMSAYPELQRISHTLKSVSGTLGMTEISKHCKILEKLFKNNGDKEEINHHFHELSVKYATTTSFLVDALAKQQQTIKPHTLDKTQTLDKLMALKQLLIDSDFSSIELMKTYENDFLFHFNDQFALIQKAATNFDMDTAIKHIDSIE